jgi:pimeloyl-ACP methyl ester carboxylesterase
VTVTVPQFITTPQGRRIAFHVTPGAGPGVVFLGGFKSDMTGSKALFLQDWAVAMGRGFLRLDYSGHGASGGAFEEGCIGDWAADAMAVIDAVTTGPQVMVGSSMGGWIALLVARAMPERVAGLVGIAAAPDFTNAIWDAATAEERSRLMETGRVEQPSDYSDAPYVITRRLIMDGRQQLVLTTPLDLPFPVRLLQGADDTDVPVATAVRLLDHATSPDMQLRVVKGADHRFSTAACLAMIVAAVEEVLG